MTETIHTFLESCARLLQDHSCETAASEVLRARKHIPNVPLAPRMTPSENTRETTIEECAKRCDAVAEFIRSSGANANAAIHAAEQCAAEIRRLR